MMNELGYIYKDAFQVVRDENGNVVFARGKEIFHHEKQEVPLRGIGFVFNVGDKPFKICIQTLELHHIEVIFLDEPQEQNK